MHFTLSASPGARIIAATLLLALTACSGGGNSSVQYSLGGSADGLDGTVVLKLNGDESLTTEGGDFAFSTAFASGDSFAIEVVQHPQEQNCRLGDASGTFEANNIDDLVLVCTDTIPAISNMQPATLSPGDPIRLSGSYLDNTSIAINGGPVEVTEMTAHRLEFLAPDLPPGNYQLEIQRGAQRLVRQVSYEEPLLAGSVSSGSTHSCAVGLDSRVYCWGDNDDGQLGRGTRSETGLPAVVAGLENVTMVTAGARHACALTGEGEVYCWGKNTKGVVGVSAPPVVTTPTRVEGLPAAILVSAGDEHNCAVLAGGGVRCWGENDSGKLGDGSTTNASVPVPVAGISDAVSVSAGYSHTCALRATGEVACWGANYSGQLGDGSQTSSPVPVAVQGLSGIVAISAGLDVSCALDQDGQASCWGMDVTIDYLVDYGDPILTPTPVSGLGEIAAIRASVFSVCGLTVAGELVSLGATDGLTTDPGPTPFTRFGAVAALGDRGCGCVVDEDQQVRCGGGNPSAQPPGEYSLPVVIPGVTDAADVAIGERVCLLLENGEVQCRGYDGLIESAHGPKDPENYLESAEGFTDVLQLDVSLAQTCGLLASGEVACTGIIDPTGPLSGDINSIVDAANYNLSPAPVEGLSNIVSISAGTINLYALDDSGDLYVWGVLETDGPLNFLDFSASAVAFPLAQPVSAVSNYNARYAFNSGVYLSEETCAVLADGSVQCWTTDDPEPVTVEGLSDIRSVAIGFDHACALDKQGGVSCWGANDHGQLGDGTGISSDAPVQVVGLSQISAITAGTGFSCALSRTGDVFCWGQNYGAFDNGETADVLAPVVIEGVVDVAALNAGHEMACGVYTDGALTCWGDHYFLDSPGTRLTETAIVPPVTLPGQ